MWEIKTMKSKKKKKNNDNKYFKWGLTAFLTIIAVLFVVEIFFNSKFIKDQISNIVSIMMPIIDGFIVAYLLIPVINSFENKVAFPFCQKKKIEINKKIKTYIRICAVILSYFMVFTMVYVFIKMVMPQLIDSIQNIINNMPVYLDTIIVYANKLLESLDLFEDNDVVKLVDTYYYEIMNFLKTNVLPTVSDWGLSLTSSAFSVLGALWNLIIGFIISIYILMSKEKFVGQGKKVIYSIFNRETANLILSDLRYINKTFSGFIVGKIVDSIIIGLLCFIILTICNIPYAILVSVIVGVTNIIPFFGPFIGAIPSIILIFLVSPIQALYFLIIVIILQQVDGNLIGPVILGNSTGLSGFWVIFAITFFGGLWGILGMLLGVPLFGCLFAWFKRHITANLIKRKMNVDTESYINLKEINVDNEYIENDPVLTNYSTLGKNKNDDDEYIILNDGNKDNIKSNWMEKLNLWWNILKSKVTNKKKNDTEHDKGES